jgi:hypothetical protein
MKGKIIMIKCLFCEKEHENKKFCSLSCSSSYYGNIKKKPIKYNVCINCSKNTTNPKFCSISCSMSFNNNFRIYNKNRTLKNYCCKKCGILLHIGWQQGKNKTLCDNCNTNNVDWSKITLLEFKQNRPNYQVHSRIRSIARSFYKNSDKPKHCTKCSWSTHYEICHIKPIGDFDDSSTIAEINHIDNLVALCPNCHWAFDHGHLQL